MIKIEDPVFEQVAQNAARAYAHHNKHCLPPIPLWMQRRTILRAYAQWRDTFAPVGVFRPTDLNYFISGLTGAVSLSDAYILSIFKTTPFLCENLRRHRIDYSTMGIILHSTISLTISYGVVKNTKEVRVILFNPKTHTNLLELILPDTDEGRILTIRAVRSFFT